MLTLPRLTSLLTAGLIFSGAVGTAVAGVSSAPVVVAVTLDLTRANFEPTGFTYVGNNAAFSPPFQVDLAIGDTFDFTIRFLGSQTLTLQNPSQVWALAYANSSAQVTGTGQLHLLGADGLPFLSSNSKTDTEGEVHFGQSFYDADFSGGLPASLTFSGLRYIGTVDAYTANPANPVVLSRTYNAAELVFTADAHVISIPEPATWGLMLAGIGVVGFIGARGRRTAP